MGCAVKVGDLVKLPQNHGYSIVMKIVDHKPGIRPSRSVMVLALWGEDWWDADYCEVIR